MDIGILIFVVIVVINIFRFFKKAAEGYNSTPGRKPRQEVQQSAETAPSPAARFDTRIGRDEEGEGVTYEWRDLDRQQEAEQRPAAPSMLSTGRRPQTPAKAPVKASQPQHPPKRHPLLSSKHDVARALVLGEILGEPRAKRPWGPRSARK